MVGVLRGLTRAAVEMEPLSGVPAATSRAMAELADEHRFLTPQWDEPLEGCYSVARVLRFAALDHLASYAELSAAKRTPVYAHQVLIRAGLDVSGRAYWLLDPDVGPDVRVKRHQLNRLVMATQQKRGPVEIAKAKAEEVQTNVREGCSALGWEVDTSGKYPKIDGEPALSPKKMIRAVLHDDRIFGRDDPGIGALLWWHLSGITHGSFDALAQSLSDPPMQAASPTPGSAGVMRAIVTDAGTVVHLGLTAAQAFTNTIDRWSILTGHTSTQWVRAKGQLDSYQASVAG